MTAAAAGELTPWAPMTLGGAACDGHEVDRMVPQVRPPG